MSNCLSYQEENVPDLHVLGQECEIRTTPPEISINHQEPGTSSQAEPSLVITTDTATSPIKGYAATLSAEKFRFDPPGIHNYTGLQDYLKFLFVFNTLGPAVYHLCYLYGPVPEHFSVLDRFFLVLIKLRKCYTNFDLSRFFDIPEAVVYNVFCTWVRFMSLQWRELQLWGNRDLIHFYTPTGFKNDFPKTRVIIDGTECPIKKPKLPTAQQATYSTYKNKNTIKVLVGISPGGMCTYVSPAYGGSASDRQIVERSSLTSDCVPGDAIMSDKGFDVQDIFAPYHVVINIPTFFKKKTE